MKAQMMAAMAAAVLAAGQVSADEPQDYSALILLATSHIGRSIGPSEYEVKVAERAISLLRKEKEAVATFIIGRLQNYRVPPNGPAYISPANSDALLQELGIGQWQWGYYGPVGISSAHYGAVLCEFGPEYVSRLEPAVLKASGEEARVAGAHILAACRRPEAMRKAAVDLLARIIERDNSPAVQEAAIYALNNLGAVDRSDLVTKYLASEHAEVRRATVDFYWSFPTADGFDRLEAMVETEKNLKVGFQLALALCRRDKTRARTLLTHRNDGIRGGALHYLAQGSVDVCEEDRAAVAGRLEAETDIRCQYEIAECLRKWKDPRSLGFFIAILRGPEDPDCFRGGNVKVAAAAALANLTDLPCGITDKDRARVREVGGSLYDEMAARCDAWWSKNKGRVVWSERQSKFIVAAKGTDTDAQPPGRGDAEDR